MAQFGRPISDVSIANEISNSTGLPDFYTSIDEIVSDDDTTRLESSANHGTDSEFGLSSLIDPTVNTGHILRVRAYSDDGSLNVYLKQGTTIIHQTLGITLGAWTTYEFNLLEAEAANITDYSDLRFAFDIPFQGNRGAELFISQAELEIPDANAGLVKLIKVGNAWKNIDNIQVITGGSWKNYQDLKIKTNNNWKNT